MANLAQWLEENLSVLVDAATAELSQNEALKSEVFESVSAFYDGLLRSARLHSPTPLNTILIDWVESRSAPTEEEMAGLGAVLVTLKQVTWQQISLRCTPPEAIDLLFAGDQLFTEALVYLFQLETDALLAHTRNQLEAAQRHVERLDKSKSNFIAVAAHELRTPLTLIEGYTKMMRGVDQNEQVALLLDGVDAGVKRLREIINDMIDVSLIDLNLLELYFQPVWLHQLLAAVERMARSTLAQRNLEFVIEWDAVPKQPTYGDQERLLQVLHKVVINAIKYTPDGGRVVISARTLPGFVDIIVTDTGIGISPADLPHIFDTFSGLGDIALHSSGKTKFKGGGPGLGLSIAKGIIEAHGGTIWAESDGYDEQTCPGSAFHIMIPMRVASPDDTMVSVYDTSPRENP
jgi:signal transduction histidine kinase